MSTSTVPNRIVVDAAIRASIGTSIASFGSRTPHPAADIDN